MIVITLFIHVDHSSMKLARTPRELVKQFDVLGLFFFFSRYSELADWTSVGWHEVQLG